MGSSFGRKSGPIFDIREIGARYLYPEQPYQVKEYGKTEATLLCSVGGRLILQQNSES